MFPSNVVSGELVTQVCPRILPIPFDPQPNLPLRIMTQPYLMNPTPTARQPYQNARGKVRKRGAMLKVCCEQQL